MSDTSHMKVTPMKFTLREIVSGYTENDRTNQVIGMDGRLDIRPKYQREFRYTKEKQDALIRSVLSDYPISVMYWVQTGTDQNGQPKYEVLDGQQRLISLCRFMTKGNTVAFNDDIVSYGGNPDAIDNYDKLIIYVCEKGDTQTDESFEKEKLAWFETINIAGAVLTKQEIRSALKYSDWCTSAKSHFVHKDRSGDTAYSYGVQRRHKGNDYLNVKNYNKNDKDEAAEKSNSDSYQTQEIFEKVLRWITGNGLEPGSDEDILRYMEIHKDSRAYPDATDIWAYFKNVMDWVWEIFEGTDETRYESKMKEVEWGLLYNEYHDTLKPIHTDYETKKAYEAKKAWIRERVDTLKTFDVDQAGKYAYVLDEAVNGHDAADTKVLKIRAFKEKDARKMYQKQHGICPGCGKHFEFEEMQADHIVPWSQGGFTDDDNLQMLCADCNLKKSDDQHFGQKYSRNDVIAFTEDKVKACPKGKLNVAK